MSTPPHQDEPGGWDAALPRLSLAKLVHPGMNLLERVAQGTAPAPVGDVHLVGKGLV